ncbi:phage tail protein, partial [Yersinia enterocolitica]
TEAEWQADPLKRMKWSSGNGTTTFRLPDENGKSPGSVGAPVRRGDGAKSNGVTGTIQMDAFQGHAIGLSGTRNSGVFAYVGTGGTVGVNTIANTSAVTENLVLKDDGTNGTPRVAAETRMLNATGCYVILLAGTAFNEGQINALELATQITLLTTRVTTLEARKQPQFAYVYPGGTQASPGNITLSQRVEVTNPFPGRKTDCRVEVLVGAWGEMRDGSNIGSGSSSYGIAASYVDDKIVVVSANQQLGSYSPLTLNGFSNNANVATTLPYRVAVWTID